MTERANEWKVGAFIASAVALLVATLFWLGVSRFDSETVSRVTYFDESVQGLEVGAPVKIRGVTIGKVTDIMLAPDHRLVEVRAEIEVAAMRSMNVIGQTDVIDETSSSTPSEMRIIVAAQGITGIKFLEADFFPPETPKIELSFDPPPTYVPSAPSTLKSLEDAVRGLGDELPATIREIRLLASTLEGRIAEVDAGGLVESVRALSDDLRRLLDPDREGGIGSEARGLVKDLRGTTRSLDQVLAALGGPDGAVERITASVEQLQSDMGSTMARIDELLAASDLPGASASVSDAAASAGRLADELGVATRDLPGVLQDLRAALRSIDGLVKLLERDPGVLLRGRDGSGTKR